MEHFDAFLSYAGADAEVASWLHGQLEAAGIRVFFDRCDLVPGTPVGSGLADAVRRSTYFVPLVTAEFTERKWPLYELESALAHAPVGKVIPVMLGVGRDQMPAVLRPFSPLILARDRTTAGESVEVLVALLRGDDVPALRRRLREPRPDPRYPDASTRDAGIRLRELYRERALATAAGEDTRAITERVLALRREIRSGPQLRAGDHLSEGRFELIEIIGAGGFATVWKAYDARDQRVVALKLLHGQHLRDASTVERFSRGARTMAGIRHPGVASIVEATGQEDGYCYFVMEYLPGGDLGQAVAAGRFRGLEGLGLLLVVGEALEYAHSRGLVHRDVKPDNILLDQIGGPRLTDFDLVKDANTTGGTRVGAGLGTFMYAAPEARLDAGEAAPTADVYSFGMTALFVLCGGNLPARAASRPEDVLEQVAAGRELRRVIARAIAFEASERFASMAQFCDALRRALACGEPLGVPRLDSSAIPPRPLLLEARHVLLQFGPRFLLRDLSLAILQGELVGILGSSGSGAGALFRVLAGRLRPSQGEVHLRGLPIDPSRIGVVADDAFAPGLTVHALLRNHLSMRAVAESPPASREQRQILLESVGLDDAALGHRPDELSRDMRRRLSIALELAAHPDALFLEDVTRDLDARSTRSIVHMCRALSARGHTVVMAVPALSDAEFHLFDRVVVISHAELAWSGPPYEAVAWFERRAGRPAPLNRTAVDFLHEASAAEAGDQTPFTATSEYEQHVGEPLRRRVEPPAPIARPSRVWPLTRLYAEQVLRRRGYLAFRILQAPAIATAVIFQAPFLPSDDFVYSTVLVAVAFWLGASGAGTEVVRERAFFLHQRSAGVSPSEYLASKLPLQVLLVSLQIGLFLFTPGRRGGGLLPDTANLYLWADPTSVPQLGVLWCVGIAATLAGLAASTIVAVGTGTGHRVPVGWLSSVAAISAVVVMSAWRALMTMLSDRDVSAANFWNIAVLGAASVAGYLLAVRAAKGE